MKPASGLLTGLRYCLVALAVALGLGFAGAASADRPTDAHGNGNGQNGNSANAPLGCNLNFADVPTTDEFYPYVMCLACQGIISGYPCGGPNEPCNENNDPYFRPNDPVTRGQIAKILSISAGFNEPVPSTQQTYADVPYGSTFWEYVERLASRGVLDGFACGGANEPCDSQNRPYFRPFDNTNRGQLMKAVNEALHAEGTSGNGGGTNGVAGAGSEGLVTRAETAEVVSKAFFPDCNP